MVHGRPSRRTTLVRLKRPSIVKLFVVPEDDRHHTDFAGSLNIPEDWFGSTLLQAARLPKGLAILGPMLFWSGPAMPGLSPT